MTLRTWSIIAILGIFALILSAHAAKADGLWDDMGTSGFQKMATKVITARVVGVSATGSTLVYKITTESDDTSSLRFCEGTASTVVNTVLQIAYNSKDKEPVELIVTSSPFNQCVVTARVAKKA